MAISRLKNREELINDALLVYLGATLLSPGYQPVERPDERLKLKYLTDYQTIREDVESIVLTTMEIEVDWSQFPWPKKAADFIEVQIEVKFPWLNSAVRKSLAAYFVYQWK